MQTDRINRSSDVSVSPYQKLKSCSTLSLKIQIEKSRIHLYLHKICQPFRPGLNCNLHNWIIIQFSLMPAIWLTQNQQTNQKKIISWIKHFHKWKIISPNINFINNLSEKLKKTAYWWWKIIIKKPNQNKINMKIKNFTT